MIATVIKPTFNASLYLKREDDHYIIINPKNLNHLVDLFEYLRNANPLDGDIDYQNGGTTPQLVRPYILYDHVEDLKIEIFGKVKHVTVTKPKKKLIAVIDPNPNSNDVKIETLQFDTFDELFSHKEIESIFYEALASNCSVATEEEIQTMIEDGTIEDPLTKRVKRIMEKN